MINSLVTTNQGWPKMVTCRKKALDFQSSQMMDSKQKTREKFVLPARLSHDTFQFSSEKHAVVKITFTAWLEDIPKEAQKASDWQDGNRF